MANDTYGSSRALRSKLAPGRGGGIKQGLWLPLLEGSEDMAFLSFTWTGATEKEDCGVCITHHTDYAVFLQGLLF